MTKDADDRPPYRLVDNQREQPAPWDVTHSSVPPPRHAAEPRVTLVAAVTATDDTARHHPHAGAAPAETPSCAPARGAGRESQAPDARTTAPSPAPPTTASTYALPSTIVGVPAPPAPEPAARARSLAPQVRQLGFDCLSAGRVARLTAADGTTTFGLQPLARLAWLDCGEWTPGYFRRGDDAFDLRVHDVLGGGLPCVWDLPTLRRESLARWPGMRTEQLLERIERKQLQSGLMLAVATLSHTDMTIVSLGSRTAGVLWLDDTVIAQAWMLASLLLEQARRVEHGLQAEPPRTGAKGGVQASALAPPIALSDLSRLEQQILRHVAEGLADKAIATRLGLSAHNVDYHMRKLRLRFGAHNRVQLLQAAGALLD